uniref:ATP-dependent Clp protease proteolytic subunit n=5 Tax=indigoferoid/millettioid clade TaxID=2233855 RepID=A0A6M4EF03_9FABA|nr:ClpP [Sarcodum scandens]YP_010294651.1 ATP-dependent Clp protease proteolytic subunit [Callerya nitida var. hirsutissima]YP_010321229.1 clp protease proteolytic subunit [Wisteriopsis japonica]YP_010353052.1 ATP-dependent Clp protease proteolytic subunit [Callerya dielsiana]YP_010353129.1 ATP-dependent Clp protease proteolytic subunit [Wisteriopsis reticulata]YP_010398228.1 ATP-dependent Clp protease proteolytic subunit [Callerya nitida]QJQ79985.1 ClpP [Austrocallerya megasperma]QXE39967.1
MPIGIPKVPFRVPGDDEASWIDLYNRLYQERLLFLGQEVNSEISNQLVGLMIYLSLEDNNKDLYLLINSPGGEVISGMGIFDTMQLIEAEVQTVCVGLAASMGSLLLVGGEITKRLAFPRARVMIHQPASSFYEGQTAECVLEADELLKMRKTMTTIYAQRTGKPSWQIYKDMERDLYMSAEEAQAYGIIDMVADSL